MSNYIAFNWFASVGLCPWAVNRPNAAPAKKCPDKQHSNFVTKQVAYHCFFRINTEAPIESLTTGSEPVIKLVLSIVHVVRLDDSPVYLGIVQKSGTINARLYLLLVQAHIKMNIICQKGHSSPFVFWQLEYRVYQF